MTAYADWIVLDVETGPTRDEGARDRLRREVWEAEPAKSASAKVKAEFATETARLERLDEAIGKTALDPLRCELLCACWRTDRFDEVDPYDLMTGPGDVEELITHLDGIVGPSTIIAGHNIAGFDLPVMSAWFLRNQIDPPEHWPRWTGRGWTGRVYDTMAHLPATKWPNFISLDAACAAFGIIAKRYAYKGAPMNGSRVREALEAGDYLDILAYCATDVEAEVDVFLRLTHGGERHPWRESEEVRRQLAAIEGSAHSRDAKDRQIVQYLESIGKIPREANRATDAHGLTQRAAIGEGGINGM